MSKPRLQVFATIDSEAHCDTIVQSVKTQLAGKDIFEEHAIEKWVDDDLVGVRLRVDVRFNSNVDRNNVRIWVMDQIQNHPQVKDWITKAKVFWHTCTHDDGEIHDCKTTDYFEWNKA